MKITKQESRVLLAGIFYCKEQGMDDDWIEGYLIEQIDKLSKFHQLTVSYTVGDVIAKASVVQGIAVTDHGVSPTER